MEDPELEAIRQRRMAEMMAASGGAPGAPGMPSAEDAEQQEEARRAAEEQRRTMLHAVMTPDARERLARVALVKPDKARNVENMVLTAAKRGALQSKVTEDQLKGMLEQISERESAASKITIQRRRPMFEDDE
ncbi:programmed cell death protein 5 [Scenedesmus sp. NREL 46B-D3]|nr:programmed cell death protein 5 [Scenedesmus sp. NREL 46B-D3]